MAAAKCFLSGITFFLLEAGGLNRKCVGASKAEKAGRSPNTGTYGRSAGGKSYHDIVLSGRIVTGSSPFTSLTWRSAAVAGSIYGGRAYIQKHPHERKLPPICTNSKEKSPEGRAYGYFICPREHEPNDFEYCCGSEYREYCCNKTMAQIFFSDRRKSSGSSTGLLIGIVTAVVICILIVGYCCKQRKHAENIIRRISKKDRKQLPGLPRNTLGAVQPHFGKGAGRLIVKSDRRTVEFKKPTDSFEGSGLTPRMPPPSYNALTTTALGGCDASAVSPEPQSSFKSDGDDEKIGKLVQAEDSGIYSPSSSVQNGIPHQLLDSVLTSPRVDGTGALPPDALNILDCGEQDICSVELCFFSNSIITSPSTGDAYSSLCGASSSSAASCSPPTVAPNPSSGSSSADASNPLSRSLSAGVPNLPLRSPSSGAPNELSRSPSSGAPNPPSRSPSSGAPNQLSRTPSIGASNPPLISPSTGAPNPPLISPSIGAPNPPSRSPSNGAPNPPSRSPSNGAPNPPSRSPSNGAPNQLSRSPSVGASNPPLISPSTGAPNPPLRSPSTGAPNPPSRSPSNGAPKPPSRSPSNVAPNQLSRIPSIGASNPPLISPSTGAPNPPLRSPSTGAPNPPSRYPSNGAPNPPSRSPSNGAPNQLSRSSSIGASNPPLISPSTGTPNPPLRSPSTGVPNPPSRSTSCSLSAGAQYPSSTSCSPSEPYSPASNISYPTLLCAPVSSGDSATHQPSQGPASALQGEAPYSSSAAVMHLTSSPANSEPPFTDNTFYSPSATEGGEPITCEFLSPFI